MVLAVQLKPYIGPEWCEGKASLRTRSRKMRRKLQLLYRISVVVSESSPHLPTMFQSTRLLIMSVKIAMNPFQRRERCQTSSLLGSLTPLLSLGLRAPSAKIATKITSRLPSKFWVPWLRTTCMIHHQVHKGAGDIRNVSSSGKANHQGKNGKQIREKKLEARFYSQKE